MGKMTHIRKGIQMTIQYCVNNHNKSDAGGAATAAFLGILSLLLMDSILWFCLIIFIPCIICIIYFLFVSLWTNQTAYLTDDYIRISNIFSKNVCTLYYKDCILSQSDMIDLNAGLTTDLRMPWIAIYRKEENIKRFRDAPINFFHHHKKLAIRYDKDAWEYLRSRFPEEDVEFDEW
jgi:hypothetical protein